MALCGCIISENVLGKEFTLSLNVTYFCLKRSIWGIEQAHTYTKSHTYTLIQMCIHYYACQRSVCIYIYIHIYIYKCTYIHMYVYQRQMTCGNLLWDNNKMQKILANGSGNATSGHAAYTRRYNKHAHTNLYKYIFTSLLLLVCMCAYGGFG